MGCNSFICIRSETHTRLNKFKAENKLKSHDQCIKELLDFWGYMP